MYNLISDELNSALCEQIGHEKYNSNLYLFIAGFLKNKGLNNLGGIYEKQHEEEFEHSKMIFDILTDLNSPVVVPEIDEINKPINSIMDIAVMYFEREVLTTASLDAIKKMAIEQECPVVEEALRDMIKLQRHEYAEACDFIDKAQLAGNNWFNTLLWDLGSK